MIFESHNYFVHDILAKFYLNSYQFSHHFGYLDTDIGIYARIFISLIRSLSSNINSCALLWTIQLFWFNDRYFWNKKSGFCMCFAVIPISRVFLELNLLEKKRDNRAAKIHQSEFSECEKKRKWSITHRFSIQLLAVSSSKQCRQCRTGHPLVWWTRP